jgi:hypothetical protein
MAKVDEATAAFVASQFDTAYQLQEEYSEFVERRKGNRDMLKNLATQGLLSAQQGADLEELYPSKVRMSPEDRIAALEDQLRAARERATSDTDEAEDLAVTA